MKYRITTRQLDILLALDANRGTPLRAKDVAWAAGMPQHHIYPTLDRMKSWGWFTITMNPVPEKKSTPMPFYSITPLGLMALRYAETERLSYKEANYE